jgi:tetratricopeptide (TPR) repeat protein
MNDDFPLQSISAFATGQHVMVALQSASDLITLTGPAGVGKTYQAQRIQALRQGRARTTHWISLAASHRGVDICVAVAAALRIPARGGIGDNLLLSRIEGSLAAASDQLFILDGAEDAAAELSPLLERWVKLGGGARFLVTTRAPLGVPGEQVVEVSPLLTDAPADTLSPALTLLLEKAEEAGWEEGRERSHRPSLNALASLLGGHPRALALMAGQLGRVAPDWLLAELRKHLLHANGADLDAFPAELHAATACAISLLSKAERTVLAQCGLFRSDFDPDLASSTFEAPDDGSVADLLDDLWAQHLLERSDRAGRERFALDQNLRASAHTLLQSLGNEESLWRGVAQGLIQGASAAAAAYEASGDPAHLQFLYLEQENLLAVLERSLGFADDEKQGEDALALVAALDPLFALTMPLGQHEEYLDRAILQVRSASIAPELLGRVHRQRGNLRRLMGNLGGAAANFAEALHLTHGREHARTLVDLGVLQHQRGAFAQARRAYKEAFALAQGVDRHTAARALGNLGALFHDLGENEKAADFYAHAVITFEKSGNLRLAGLFHTQLAILRQEQGRWYDARGHFLDALERLEPVGDRRLLGMTESALGVLDHEEGALVQARLRQLKAIALLQTAGDLRTTALAHLRLSMVLALLGKNDEAERHRQRGQVFLTRLGDPVAESLGQTCTGFVELGRALADLGRGDRSGAEPHYRAARDALRQVRYELPSPLEWSDEVRSANRLLHQALAPHRVQGIHAHEVPMLKQDGSAFSLASEGEQSLEHRPALAGILALLIKARVERPGQSINQEALAHAGWPNSKFDLETRENRVLATIAALRRLGLGALICEADGEYLLDPAQDLDIR